MLIINKSDIFKNQKVFKKLLYKANMEVDKEKQYKRLKKAISFVTTASTGYYSCARIERAFIEIAQAHSLNKVLPPYKKNTVLHVMSRSYKVGGHTRVVERWIELSDPHQRQSLVFTQEDQQEIPDRLRKAVSDKQGELVILSDRLSDIEKGLQLREIASQFEFIVLHVHPDDVIPLLAFGNKEFTRPIIFFNHADHRFWLGVSISDIVADLRSFGQSITLNKRGAKNSIILGIPIDAIESKSTKSKTDIRKKLALPINKKIILSIGGAHKYKPLGNYNFINVAKEILEEHQEAIFILIGPDFKVFPDWEVASETYDNRIKALGYMPHKAIFDYIIACDLVLDSFPMSGGTALIDAISCQKPVLSLVNPVGQLDFVIISKAYCENKEVLLSKINKLLSDPCEVSANVADVTEKLMNSNSLANWQNKLTSIYRLAEGLVHTIHSFNSVGSDIIDNDLYLYSEDMRFKHKKYIPYLFDYYIVWSGGIKYREFVFFNKYKIKIKA